MKKWWKSRTLWLNVLTAVFSLLELQLQMLGLEPRTHVAVLLAVNAVNVVLRFITTQPISK